MDRSSSQTVLSLSVLPALKGRETENAHRTATRVSFLNQSSEAPRRPVDPEKTCEKVEVNPSRHQKNISKKYF